MNSYNPTAREAAINVIVIMAILIFFALHFVEHPTPWSPLGKGERVQRHDHPTYDVPDGWKIRGTDPGTTV